MSSDTPYFGLQRPFPEGVDQICWNAEVPTLIDDPGDLIGLKAMTPRGILTISQWSMRRDEYELVNEKGYVAHIGKAECLRFNAKPDDPVLFADWLEQPQWIFIAEEDPVRRIEPVPCSCACGQDGGCKMGNLHTLTGNRICSCERAQCPCVTR